MKTVEYNFLADFYSRLGVLALERDQIELAADYFNMANLMMGHQPEYRAP